MASYTYLDAGEGVEDSREVRRPRHNGNVTAIAALGPLGASATASYVGRRDDVDFETFPARTVALDDYVLLDVAASYALTGRIALTARIENVLDADYEDVLAYETPGTSIYAGVKFRWGD